MKPWSDFIANPEALAVYDSLPSLHQVEFLSCEYQQGMSSLAVHLSLEELPVRRPARWNVEMNRLAMTLQLSVTSSTIRQRCFGAEGALVDCVFTSDEPGFRFECEGEKVSLVAHCDAAWVQKMNGYSRVPLGKEQEYA